MPYNSKFESHIIQFSYPFAGDLLVRSIHGKERMSSLFEFRVDLTSADGNLDFKKLVGHQVTAKLRLGNASDGDGGFRYFNGFITEFGYLGAESEDSFRYHATLRPWFWLLTRTSDCRIFQNKKVPDIIKEVFKFNNMVDYEENLKSTYREWEYCVQYNESDFDFISRLMEQEGIYYFFKHQDGKHILMMVDDGGAHVDYPGFAEVTYNPGYAAGSVVADSLHYCSEHNSIMPNIYALQDYDFINPKTPLLAKYQNIPSGYDWPLADPEIFDYPGEYVNRGEGSRYAEIRLQELQCQWERMQADGQCRGLSAGYTFTLKDSPRTEQNRKYLTIAVDHEMNNQDAKAGRTSFTGQEETKFVYRCKVEAMFEPEGARHFRAPRVTPKPIVRGPQTAVVVGPSGDEIYTDEYARVKVQFHWDRYGLNDQNSSCWVRVSQIWAGAKWGGIHIPRIGQEVVVSFLEGDPDRPLITGSVYNANCMPPYALAANKTQSGIKSRSTLGGGTDNFNEIRMEDKIGNEELYIHAEKNHTNITENDRTESVGHDRSTKVGNDYTRNVGHDSLINVGYEGKSQGSYTMNVCKDRIESVSNGDYKIGVNTGSRELYVKSNDKVEVKGSRLEVIENTLDSQCKDLKLTGSTTMLAKSPDVKIQGASNTYIGDALIKISGTTIDVNGTTINITGTAGVNIACGGSSVKLNAGGVQITGPMVNINT